MDQGRKKRRLGKQGERPRIMRRGQLQARQMPRQGGQAGGEGRFFLLRRRVIGHEIGMQRDQAFQ
jgi:hypothetical protein